MSTILSSYCFVHYKSVRTLGRIPINNETGTTWWINNDVNTIVDEKEL